MPQLQTYKLPVEIELPIYKIKESEKYWNGKPVKVYEVYVNGLMYPIVIEPPQPNTNNKLRITLFKCRVKDKVPAVIVVRNGVKLVLPLVSDADWGAYGYEIDPQILKDGDVTVKLIDLAEALASDTPYIDWLTWKTYGKTQHHGVGATSPIIPLGIGGHKQPSPEWLEKWLQFLGE